MDFFEEGVLVWGVGGGGCSVFFSGLIFLKKIKKSSRQNVNFIIFGQRDLRYDCTL